MTSILPVASRFFFIFLFLGYGFFCATLVFYLAENIVQKPKGLSAGISNTSITSNKTEVITPLFSTFTVISEKKEYFFEFFTPLIKELNTEIRRSRSRLLNINKSLAENDSKDNYILSRQDRFFIMRITALYGITDTDTNITDKIQRLLKRVDELPPSMVLAQAATESAWGTSRFAVKGNNYFGEWCFKSGCGFIPRLRRANSHHEVAKFNTVRDSLRSYFFNINTHRAYRELRGIRENLRKENKNLDGRILAEGLIRYSERRESYVAELKSIITTNQLYLLDDNQAVN